MVVCINHQEVILLPLDQKLPVKVHKEEGANFLVDNDQSGYIELTVSRCDDSTPSMAYSFSAE